MIRYALSHARCGEMDFWDSGSDYQGSNPCPPANLLRDLSIGKDPVTCDWLFAFESKHHFTLTTQHRNVLARSCRRGK